MSTINTLEPARDFNVKIYSMKHGRRRQGREQRSAPLAVKEPPFIGGAILRIAPPVKGGSFVAKGADLRSLPRLLLPYFIEYILTLKSLVGSSVFIVDTKHRT